jgi:hypothetical protein
MFHQGLATHLACFKPAYPMSRPSIAAILFYQKLVSRLACQPTGLHPYKSAEIFHTTRLCCNQLYHGNNRFANIKENYAQKNIVNLLFFLVDILYANAL